MKRFDSLVLTLAVFHLTGPHSNSLVCAVITTNINYPVTQKCVCEAMSSCNTNGSCTGDMCGLFKITWAYWVGGGGHTE
ncbi:hypothetical protein MTP99_018668 [Tenebrio molitor]|nr:hypothetical protein MTP99_018668 [Tenebrio molitor]